MAIRGRALILLFAFTGAAFAAEPAPLPLIGSDTPDAWGVPTRTANKLVLRRMLFERRFVELVTALEGLQAMSDADCQLELMGLDAFEAFQSRRRSSPWISIRSIQRSRSDSAPALVGMRGAV